MKRWYVIRTKPKKEKDVENQLGRASYETFLPRMRSLASTKPLFPSYLFIRTDFEISYHHRMVRFTRGVSHILGDSEGPWPVPDLMVETIREMTRDGSVIEQELLFKEGDPVIIKRGMLKDLVGIIEKNLSDQGRVKVLFKWLNNSVRAFLRYRDLEKAA